MVLRANPLNSAFSMLLSFAGLCGLYMLLLAKVALIFQIVVYAGAILMLIIFAIMMLNLNKEKESEVKAGYVSFSLLAVFLGLAFYKTIISSLIGWNISFNEPAGHVLGIKALSEVLYTDFAIPFILVSVLLLVALMAAFLLARKEKA